MKTQHYLTLIASALLSTATMGLAAPVNDDFANAIDLAGDSGAQTGTGNVDATMESGEPECVYPGTDNTVWFKWTASQSGTLNLSTTGSINIDSNGWDAAICVYTGTTLATLDVPPLVSQDTGLDESCSLPVTAGTTYFIQAGGYPNPPADVATNILLTWSYVPPLVTVNSPDVISIDVVRTDSTAVSGDVIGSPVTGQTGLWNRLDGSTEPQTLATLTNGAGTTATGIGFSNVSKSGYTGFQSAGSSTGVVLAANDPERLWVSGSGTRTFEFTGLTNGGSYGLVIFNSGPPQGIITINDGIPNTALPTIFYTNEVADSAGKITVVVSFNGAQDSQYMEVSGFQLYPVAAASGYDSWATTNAGGQAANLDYDSDGVANGVEYFMGATGSSFTANPSVVTTAGVRTVTWPRDPTAVIASFKVQVSDNLTNWTDIVPPNASINESNPNQVIYTLPSGAAKKFCRLVVTP